MDEQRLSELFRDAAGQPPPASFDTGDVVGASRRATARRRSAVAGGALLGVAVLAGGVVVGGQLLAPPPDSPSAGSEAAAPEVGDRMLEPTVRTPFADPPGARTDRVPGSAGGCGPADAELAAGLAAALKAGPAVPFPKSCPRGFRAAGVVVPGGTVYALLGPSAVPPGGGPGSASAPADGQILSVVSVPSDPADVPPRADEVDDIAAELADRF